MWFFDVVGCLIFFGGESILRDSRKTVRFCGFLRN